MPPLTLHRKVFLALTVLLLALLLMFAGLSRWGLQRGLGPYVADIELARLGWLAERLQTHHTESGGWQRLRAEPGLWGRLSHPGWTGSQPQGVPLRSPAQTGTHSPESEALYPPPPPPGPPPFERPGTGPRGGPKPPPRHTDDLFPRLGVLDEQERVVAGTPPTPGSARTALRGADGAVIGHLVLAPPPGLRSEADQAFLAQQMGFIAGTGLAGLALALLLSGWITRRWLAPVEALAHGANRIAQGHLDTRVPAHGHDELAQLTRTFNTMAEQLSNLEASRRQWLSDVAHELRTPLAAMRAEIEALQDGVRPFDDKTALRLHRQVMRLIQLVGDLRASLDTTHHSAFTARVPVHPLPLLAEALASMRLRFALAAIEVDATGLQALATMPTPPLVHGDAEQLQRVFLNLLENSLRYTDPGGLLRIHACLIPAENGPPHLQVQFDDSAPGVPSHELPRLFDRLYRAESSRNRDHGGSGLGLAICRAIVLAHGGTLSAEPSALGGLRLTLLLPLLDTPTT
ncbi:ATP-binding protein [Acidovorax lacteus]|uniref:Signal transduction histidine-protein kinase/phosphatase MprB n=1 Tax=Acidovorax lacteus TaxID=1924988 RepID=A0ABP8LJU3_9BURK